MRTEHTGDGMSPPRTGTDASGVVFDGVTKRFGDRDGATIAVEDVSFTARRGAFVTLLGPSGSGKSTLLRIAAGLLGADRGAVSIFGESVDEATRAKEVGFVPKAPALLPWRTVLENVHLPLEVNRRAAVTPGRTPEEILAAVGLGDVMDRRPDELSGGMRQRVAIARAFALEPCLLLMDEPFSALDELTRETLRAELLELWSTTAATVLFVTHSVAEAVLLSDEVVVLTSQPGRVKAVVPVPLARPRSADDEFTQEFAAVARQVREALRSGWVDPGA